MAATRRFGTRHIRGDMADDVEMHLNDAIALANTIADSLEEDHGDNKDVAVHWRARAVELQGILSHLKKLAR